MKKIVCLLLCLVMVSGLVVAMCACENTPREEILKLYMPGEYIDEDIFEQFESWYEETTGKKVKVTLETFNAVENIQLALEGSKADYDLICPSDYMVEYLIGQDLLLPIDVDITKEGLFKSQYVNTTAEFDPECKYSLPYMYGTLGIAYDITKTGKKIDSWESLFGDEFEKRRSIKKSVRDAYAATCIYNAREETAGLVGEAQKAAIQKIFEDTSDNTINNAAKILKNVSQKGAVWDTDLIKYEMAANIGNVAVAMMWSCDAGYVMNNYEDEDGNEQEGNRNLWYVLPKEGGNVYIDSFVISKYAANVDAAQKFLEFLCRKDIAIANSRYAGAISPVAEAYDYLYNYYVNDEDGIFEGTAEGWKEMFIETMFPSEETLNRCGVMKDFGSDKRKVNEMWGDIL